MSSEELRKNILHSVAAYRAEIHGRAAPFKPGDRIPYAGRVFDESELCLLVESALDFWLTTGRFAETFERNLADFLRIKHCSLVNSGSSANLLAFSALTSPLLGERQVRRGDEVITVAAGFPTTVTPIVQYGAVPVFVDVAIPSYNIDTERLDDALSPKTKAVMLAHTLGNPFDLRRVREFCDKNGLWLIEDNCDALGSRILWNGGWRYTGTVGDLGTSSFYPPHHLTMGEGGAVYTNDSKLKRIVESFRDWGRDCVCPPGKDDTCRHRFSRRYGELPVGYDHKYVYSHFGYNLKATDMQAAVGVAQLQKLPEFIEARKRNWNRLRTELVPLEEFAILPEAAPDSDPSWFGFLVTLRDDAPFSRDEIVRHLEAKNIQTRMLFAGNLLRHPCFDEMRRSGRGYRVVGDLRNTDRITEKTFWLGVYPGLSGEMIDFVVETILEFVRKRSLDAVREPPS